MTKEELKELIEEALWDGEIEMEYDEPREKRIAELEQENAELKEKIKVLEEAKEALTKDKDYFSDALDKQIEATLELQKENAELRKTETMLKVLKDRGVIRSWYYNGSYHVGNELPQQEN